MIDTIFYFPHSEADYNSALVSPGISSRTISFVPNNDGETGKIYKNGIIYGGVDSDDSGISQQITNAILGAHDYSDRRLSEASATINSSVNQKIQDAIASCNESADSKIANALNRVSKDDTDYTINVQTSNTGATITQPGTNKSFYIDIPKQDSRVDGIIATLSNITNTINQQSASSGNVSDLDTRISQLEQCCTTVQTTISNLNNIIANLEGRVSDLETQASLQPTTHTLTIANDTINVSATSGTFTIPTVQYDNAAISITDSNVSGKPSWIHTFANNGYSYDANTYTSSRSAVLTITHEGYTVTLTIVQAAAQPQVTHTLTIANNGQLTLDSSSQQANVNIPTVSYDGTPVSLTSSNISNLPSWITVAQNGTLNIAQNTSYTARTATITITYEGLSTTATITQPGAPEPEPEPEVPAGTLTIAQDTMSIGAEAQTISLPNVSYNGATISPSNLTVSTSSGITYSNGVITVPVNNSGNAKVHTVTAEYQNQTVTLTITQGDHVLSFDYQRTMITDTFTGAYDYNGYKGVVLYWDGQQMQNLSSVTVGGTASFVTVGRNTSSYSLHMDVNEGAQRTGTITFTYNGKTVTINVTQEAVDPNIGYFTETAPNYALYEFSLDGNGRQGGNDPHPYYKENVIQRAITQTAANRVTATLKLKNSNTVLAQLYAGEEYSRIGGQEYVTSNNDNVYSIYRSWNSTDGLKIGVHLEKWQGAIDAYNNIDSSKWVHESGIDDGQGGTISIDAVPMNEILKTADSIGPREFELTIYDSGNNHSATWELEQFAEHGITIGKGYNGSSIVYTTDGNTGVGAIGWYLGLHQNLTDNCDTITNSSRSEGIEYYGKSTSSVACDTSARYVKINGTSYSIFDATTNANDELYVLVRYGSGEGPNVIMSTKYGDLTTKSDIDMTNMVLMTRHNKTQGTYADTGVSATPGTGLNAHTYSTIGHASIRFVTDSDWQDS